MSVNLTRRIAALEASFSPAGQIVAFWAMNENCEPMTDREIEKGIAALKANAPANARIIPITWMTEAEAKKRGWA